MWPNFSYAQPLANSLSHTHSHVQAHTHTHTHILTHTRTCTHTHTHTHMESSRMKTSLHIPHSILREQQRQNKIDDMKIIMIWLLSRHGNGFASASLALQQSMCCRRGPDRFTWAYTQLGTPGSLPACTGREDTWPHVTSAIRCSALFITGPPSTWRVAAPSTWSTAQSDSLHSPVDRRKTCLNCDSILLKEDYCTKRVWPMTAYCSKRMIAQILKTTQNLCMTYDSIVLKVHYFFFCRQKPTVLSLGSELLIGYCSVLEGEKMPVHKTCYGLLGFTPIYF